MTKGDWKDDLVSAVTEGNTVYCGKSAGAILAGKTVETATWKVYVQKCEVSAYLW